MLLDVKPILIARDQPDRPFVSLGLVFQPDRQVNLTGGLTLPKEVLDTGTREYRRVEIPRPNALLQETQRVQNGALPRGVGPYEHV
jgi:hypothetical protein